MDSLGNIKSLGWYDKINKDILVESIQSISGELDKRTNMIQKAKYYIDDKGVSRCVSGIKSLI